MKTKRLLSLLMTLALCLCLLPTAAALADEESIAEIMECIGRDKDGIRVCRQAVDSGMPDITGTNTGSNANTNTNTDNINPDSKIKCSIRKTPP